MFSPCLGESLYGGQYYSLRHRCTFIRNYSVFIRHESWLVAMKLWSFKESRGEVAQSLPFWFLGTRQLAKAATLHQPRHPHTLNIYKLCYRLSCALHHIIHNIPYFKLPCIFVINPCWQKKCKSQLMISVILSHLAASCDMNIESLCSPTDNS